MTETTNLKTPEERALDAAVAGLELISRVYACDYEYQRWARVTLQNISEILRNRDSNVE